MADPSRAPPPRPAAVTSAPAQPSAGFRPAEQPTGVWGLVVLAGIGLVGLARLLAVSKYVGDAPPGRDGMVTLMLVLFELGVLVVGGGLALLGTLQRGLPMGVRVAAIIGGAFFLLSNFGAMLFQGMFASFR